jgi:nucleotide-binding universal stress UspA family protein
VHPVFKRIVVGTDGSETAQEAVRQAADLAKSTGAALDIVSAYGGETAAGGTRGEKLDRPADVPESAREQVNFALDTATGIAKRDGVEVQAHAEEGDPADAIINVAERLSADVIVVGNKGMTGARRFLLGSVPNKVSHHAPCSVFIIRTT